MRKSLLSANMSTFELTPSDAFLSHAPILVEPHEVGARLRDLSPDLTVDLLYNAILAGLGARNETTRASAITESGLKQWLETVKVLRTLLAEKQWRIHDLKNCPFVSSADGRISVVVMTGDKETGRQGIFDPANQAEKGSVVKGYVSVNRQLELFKAVEFAQEKNETQVWVFLYHYDKKLKEVRYELSYPTGFNRKKITEWGERLILGSIPDSPESFVGGGVEPNAPVTVEVEPKTGTF